MKRTTAALLLTGSLLATGYSSAQTLPNSAPKLQKDQTPSSPPTIPLSVGTAFNTILTDSLDTRRVKPGDTVTANTAEDVMYEQSVVIPKGSKIVGEIIRATSGGHGRAGSALFIRFHKAVLPNAEECSLNAGIQALAVNSVAPQPLEGDAVPRDKGEAMLPVEQGATENTKAPQVVSTVYDAPRKARDPLSPLPQGEINSDGLFTPDSTGAFGRPDVKIYTPTSEGSAGTVLLSAKKQLHLDSGTRLLLVIQPPPSGASNKTDPIDLGAVDQP